MKSHRGFRPTILHPASISALLLLTLSLIGLVEYACRVLPSTEHDVFQELEKRDLDSVLVAQPELVERSVTVTVIETVSISATSQTPAVRHHLNREADPQGTSAPNPDAFLQTKPTSTSSASDDSVPNPNAFLQTTSVTLAPNPNAYLQTTSVAFSVPPSAYNDPKNTPEPGAPNREAFLQAEKGYVGDNGKYFLGAYLPTVLAVFFALPWLILAQTVISLEPFYQLSESTGALAESTLTSSLFSLGSAFEALKNRRWTVILGTLLMMLSVAITPIAPETVAIQTIGGCTSGCSGFIRILIPGARVIQGILGIMSILSIVLIVLLLRRRMMVSSDPRSIAGVASLFFDPSVQQDFKEHGVAASQSTLKAALSGSAYRLSFLTRYDGVNLTALIKTRAREISPVQSLYKHDYSSLGWNRIVQQAPRYRGLASILFLLLVGLEALIITYYFTGGETGFENFMSGQGFGVRFLFTSIGIIISSYWDRVFQKVALLAPYSSLAEGNASARESILITPPAHPLLAIRTAISARHFVFAVVTVVAVLSDVLTVTLATIPFNSANFYMTYVTSTWMSVGIIALMLFALILLFFYHEPVLPIKPDTIAGHLVYLADSSLPDMFAGMAGDETKMMRRKIEGLGLRYRLRPARDVAGMLTVDVEEIGGSHDVIVTRV